MQNWVCGDEKRVFIWLEVYYNERVFFFFISLRFMSAYYI
jgi:hypothetical protein